jgi:hypothetical protein
LRLQVLGHGDQRVGRPIRGQDVTLAVEDLAPQAWHLAVAQPILFRETQKIVSLDHLQVPNSRQQKAKAD